MARRTAPSARGQIRKYEILAVERVLDRAYEPVAFGEGRCDSALGNRVGERFPDRRGYLGGREGGAADRWRRPLGIEPAPFGQPNLDRTEAARVRRRVGREEKFQRVV